MGKSNIEYAVANDFYTINWFIILLMKRMSITMTLIFFLFLFFFLLFFFFFWKTVIYKKYLNISMDFKYITYLIDFKDDGKE